VTGFDEDRLMDLLAGTAEVIEVPYGEERIEPTDGSTALFAGFAPEGPVGELVRIDSFNEFVRVFGAPDGPYLPSAALAHAVRGFFRNGGSVCWVHRLDGVPGAGRVGDAELAALAAGPSPIIAVPDAYSLAGGAVAALELQRRLVAMADEAGNRIIVLDPPPGLSATDAVLWRRRTGLDSCSAAIFYPWVDVPALPSGNSVAVPPSGHVIGSWARVDGTNGIHQAPTGQSLLGIDALSTAVSAAEQRALNRDGINCLRPFPGPEPRVWGARTLSNDTDWRYLHRRRTYVNLISSIALGTDWVGRAPLDQAALDRLHAAVSMFLQAAWRRGALHGAAAGQAFSITCEPSDKHPGHIVLEVGLALRQPTEFRVARLILRTASANDAAA
jgi:phage tail sheath protein FI